MSKSKSKSRSMSRSRSRGRSRVNRKRSLTPKRRSESRETRPRQSRSSSRRQSKSKRWSSYFRSHLSKNSSPSRNRHLAESISVSPRKRSPKKAKKSRKHSSSSSASSSSESESERPQIIKKRKVFDETNGVSFVAPTKSFDIKKVASHAKSTVSTVYEFKELKTSRRVIKKSDNVLRTVDNNMSISKCRQIVIHRKAEFTTIFSHVDQTKLPKAGFKISRTMERC